MLHPSSGLCINWIFSLNSGNSVTPYNGQLLRSILNDPDLADTHRTAVANCRAGQVWPDHFFADQTSTCALSKYMTDFRVVRTQNDCQILLRKGNVASDFSNFGSVLHGFFYCDEARVHPAAARLANMFSPDCYTCAQLVTSG